MENPRPTWGAIPLLRTSLPQSRANLPRQVENYRAQTLGQGDNTGSFSLYFLRGTDIAFAC